ncbi:MAG: hypothetical protein GF311_04495 [Candidatus Lokiarchaeota archaeon]|nr:hypothetical protein [Candidatus Lokiarchaeota archaeon]
MGYIPLYCTGYPEHRFMEKYIEQYAIKSEENENFILNGKDFSLIKNMGFNAVSLWDFRRGKHYTDSFASKMRENVDAWGRIYKDGWYSWEGVFKSEEIVKGWSLLYPPAQNEIIKLRQFLTQTSRIEYVLSLPGLFEKTWQSMGFVTFSKAFRENRALIRTVIDFFSKYILDLIRILQSAGAKIFLLADDMGYNQRTFIPKSDIEDLFFEKYHSIAELIHSHGNYLILHSDGYIENMVDLFIDMGFDAIQSIEPNAGNNIFTLFETYGDEICFIGNMDNGAMLTYSESSEVRSYVHHLVHSAKKSHSRLVISPTQQINEIVKPENVYAMITSVQTYNRSLGM